MKAPHLFLIVVTLLVSFACQRKATPPARAELPHTAPTQTATSTEEPPSVFFQIQEVSRQKTKDGDAVTWLATHGSKSGVAGFRIRMVLKAPSGGQPFVFSTGTFLREKGSQPTEFLRQIAKVLEATGDQKAGVKVDSLDFQVALLAQNQSRGSGPDQAAGGFTSTPPGDWLVTKVFVADGEGEFYLNLNPKEGRGEISLKDSDYGDIVVRELARIL